LLNGGKNAIWWHRSGTALDLHHAPAVVYAPCGRRVGVRFRVLIPPHPVSHDLRPEHLEALFRIGLAVAVGKNKHRFGYGRFTVSRFAVQLRERPRSEGKQCRYG